MRVTNGRGKERTVHVGRVVVCVHQTEQNRANMERREKKGFKRTFKKTDSKQKHITII